MGGSWSSSKRSTESKVILVTGASSGIGKESSLALLKRGHVVYGAARRVELMQDIVHAGGHVIAMDVTNEDQVVQGIERILKEQGRIDVLVNNAGYGVYGAVEDISIEEAQRQFEVNLFGLARVTQQVIPHMRKQKQGTIINMSSIVGKIYVPFGAWYVASKHALEGWSDSLRLELSSFNIRVVVIEPNTTKTEFLPELKRPLLERSKGGAYEPYAKQFAKGYEAMDANSDEPSVIASVVVKASESPRPRRRYAAGSKTGMIILLRKWFDGPIFDKIITGAFKTKF